MSTFNQLIRSSNGSIFKYSANQAWIETDTGVEHSQSESGISYTIQHFHIPNIIINLNLELLTELEASSIYSFLIDNMAKTFPVNLADFRLLYNGGSQLIKDIIPYYGTITEYASITDLPETGDISKTYRVRDTGDIYSWNGSTLVYDNDTVTQPCKLVDNTLKHSPNPQATQLDTMQFKLLISKNTIT
jgi:hypothetical protein